MYGAGVYKNEVGFCCFIYIIYLKFIDIIGYYIKVILLTLLGSLHTFGTTCAYKVIDIFNF